MLILASVAINLTLGENGIFTKAKEAKRQMEIAMIKEQIQMDILTEQLANNGKISEDKLIEILDKYGEVQTDEEGKIAGITTDNGGYYIPIDDILNNEQINPPTPETPDEGKITSITLNKKTLELEEGNTETLTITIQPENLENPEVEWTSNATTIATVDTNGKVTAIAEGTATITVNAKSDSTVKDQCVVTVTIKTDAEGNKQGESGYAGGSYNDPYIPKGFTHTEGTWNSGYTIIGETSSVGNEFVWVPCIITEQQKQEAQANGDTVQTFQKKLDYPKDSELEVTGDEPEAEDIKTSVETYGGFYIAKYEAGIEGTTANYDLPSTDRKPTDGTYKPLSQPNIGVWNYISRADAITVSKAMINYNETGVHSTLISGAAWDTTLQWITNTVDATYAEDSTNKGNYSGSIAVTSSNLTTAYSKNNIYDMAGNVWEWTTENYKEGNHIYLVDRGRWLHR